MSRVMYVLLVLACTSKRVEQPELVCENFFVAKHYRFGPPPVPGGFGFPCASDEDCPGLLRCAMVGQLGVHAGHVDTEPDIDTCQIPCDQLGDCLPFASVTPTGGRCATCIRDGLKHPGSCVLNICSGGI